MPALRETAAWTLGPLQRFVDRWYTGKHDTPLVSSAAAAWLSVLYTLTYVLPFYFSAATRPSPQLHRDSPKVISARIKSVTFSCIVATLLNVYIALQSGRLSTREILHVLGLWPISPFDVAQAVALVALLFIGPLYEAAIVDGKWRDWVRLRGLYCELASSVGWRNYVAGPISEEVVFRSLIISLHLFAKVTPWKLVFITPLYFGIAHVHHFYEYKLTHPDTPLLPSALRSVVQFSYTSLFGFFAAFVFLRTGSLPAAIAVHIFCNWMGLPRFWGRLEGPEVSSWTETRGKNDSAASTSTAGGKLGIAWTIAYYALLIVGAVGFYQNLWTLTVSSNALVTFQT